MEQGLIKASPAPSHRVRWLSRGFRSHKLPPLAEFWEMGISARGRGREFPSQAKFCWLKILWLWREMKLGVGPGRTEDPPSLAGGILEGLKTAFFFLAPCLKMASVFPI